MNLFDLRDSMEALAWATWLDYRDGFRYGLIPGEESITDRNLLELRREHPDDLHVHRYTRNKERQVGADWEWWIGTDDDGWLCVRIQAKRIYTKTYETLDHPGAKESEFQYQTLIRSCLKSHVYPFHVFYNGWEPDRFRLDDRDDDVEAWAANPWWSIHGQRRELWGCAALSSYRVASLHSASGPKRSYAPRYLKHAMPWSELFGAGVDLMSPKRSLELVQSHLFHTTVEAAESSGMQAPDIGQPSRRPDLPAYAVAVREGQAGSFGTEEFYETRGVLPAQVVVVADLGGPSPRPAPRMKRRIVPIQREK